MFKNVPVIIWILLGIAIVSAFYFRSQWKRQSSTTQSSTQKNFIGAGGNNNEPILFGDLVAKMQSTNNN